MANCFIQTPDLWATITKLCFGIVSLGLFYSYINRCYIYRYESDAEVNNCYGEYRIPLTVCVAFTFVIEPAIIISYLVAYIIVDQHYAKTPLNPTFAFTGSVAYLIVGSVLIHNTNVFTAKFPVLSSAWSDQSSYIATGALFILTGLLYFGHFASAIAILRRKSLAKIQEVSNGDWLS